MTVALLNRYLLLENCNSGILVTIRCKYDIICNINKELRLLRETKTKIIHNKIIGLFAPEL